jgi:hypothetical protein
LGWNIDDYLQSLEQDVVELLQKNKKPMNKKASVNKGQVKDKAPDTDSVAKPVIGPVTKVETLDE